MADFSEVFPLCCRITINASVRKKIKKNVFFTIKVLFTKKFDLKSLMQA